MNLSLPPSLRGGACFGWSIPHSDAEGKWGLKIVAAAFVLALGLRIVKELGAGEGTMRLLMLVALVVLIGIAWFSAP